MNEYVILTATAAACVGFVAGLCGGIGLTMAFGGSLFDRIADFSRTGRSAPVRPGATHTPGLAPEVSATMKISSAMLDRGTRDVMNAARAQGLSISEKEARDEAARMLSAIHGNGTMGGIPNA